ncbi:MAG: phage major capsid protein [Candidatus Midichloria sp.]|nr:phage major capsid protein [Candidatus Midichloria sp.]
MLKDEKSGRYLWSPSINAETPNTILGAEVIESLNMPGLEENNIVVAFADFKRAYQIVDKPGSQIATRSIYWQTLCKLFSERCCVYRIWQISFNCPRLFQSIHSLQEAVV